ncbi:MAG: hypothetical protein ACU836_13615 [Gammaproteobacteria bacterium]
MLVVRQDQMEHFRQLALASFEQEMITHSQSFAPELCAVLSNEQLSLAIHSAIANAREHGFTNRGPVRLYIEMIFLFGSGFDSDPQYPWFKHILHTAAPQMQKAQSLFERILDYQKHVSGEEAVNTLNALRNLSFFAQQPLSYTADDFIPAIIREMARIFPQKAAYLGENALQALIAEACGAAQQSGFSTSRSYALIVALMFAFGHRCTNDPLYPWISATLTDQRIVSPAARAERLERKAMTWLNHVLKNLS